MENSKIIKDLSIHSIFIFYDIPTHLSYRVFINTIHSSVGAIAFIFLLSGL